MTVQEFIDEVLSQPVWKANGARAPHKSLAVLYALGQASQGRRLVRYVDAEKPLTELLDRFGPPRAIHHPEQPVWRLARIDGHRTRIWNLTHANLVTVGAGGNPNIKDLREHVSFGLSEEAMALFQSNPAAARLAGECLAARLVPSTMRDELLEAVDLGDVNSLDAESIEKLALEISPRESVAAMRIRRDPRFARSVLDAYNNQCAVCSIKPSLDGRLFGLEAAHIRWVQAAGSDDIRNGICLCRMHHIALDRGALTLNNAHEIQISSRLAQSAEEEQIFWQFDGKRLQMPTHASKRPAIASVDWHRKEVFRA